MIAIKDREMPKNCAGCFLRFGQCSKRIYMENRPSDCPLIGVPEPHGRLIDADEFLKRALGTECFRDDFALMLEELVGESTTIIPASKED